MRTHALLALLLLSATANANAPAPAPTETRPLGDALRAEAGRPIYITAGGSGVVAHTADGKWKKVLVAGPVSVPLLDQVWELVWFVKDGKLQVLDLREPAPKPVALVAGMPDGEGYEIYTDDGEVQMAGDGLMQLRWAGTDESADGSEESSLDVDKEYTFPEIYDENHPKRIDRILAAADKAKMIPAGAAWLKKEAKRKDRAGAGGSFAPYRLREEKPIPIPGEECADDRACGVVAELGKTGGAMVVVGRACGRGGCKMSCELYDAKAKKFASPARPTEWKAKPDPKLGARCSLEWDRDGKTWILDGAVCTPAGCQKGDPALGWLDRGDLLDDNTAIQD
jgi:hypothetical protein